MKYQGRRDEDVPEAAIEAARALPPTPGLEGLAPSRPIDPGAGERHTATGYAEKGPIRSTDILPGKLVHKRGHRV